jgi:zinc protease
MRPKISLKVAAQLVLLLFLPALMPGFGAHAQGADPDRDQLLNGLRVIYLPQPGAAKVSLQLRIHSGAAFDPAGKSGLMTLLADGLFPESETNQFFEDELGGSLKVTTDYDSINIVATGNVNEIGRMLDAFRSALVDNQLSPEAFARLKTQRIDAAKVKTPSQLADEAIALRLLDQFPYGRPMAGTPETIAPIDQIELNVARDKFLNPNNATLIVGGAFDKTRVAKLLRQDLGLWRKSDRVVPSTFRQPDPPDPRVLLIDGPGTEVRMAVRGVARADADYPASMVLAALIQNRIGSMAGTAPGKRISFSNFEAHVLPGIVVMGGTVEPATAGTAYKEVWEQAVSPLMSVAPAAADLEAAKAKARAVLNERQGTVPGAGGLWLDLDTFKLSADPAKQLNAINAVTAADIQRVAMRLFKDAAVARVVLGDSKSLTPAIEQAGFKVEVRAAPVPVANPALPTTAPAKAPTGSPANAAPKNP